MFESLFTVEQGLDFIVSILIFGAHMLQSSSAVGFCYSIFSSGVGLLEEFSQCHTLPLAFNRSCRSALQKVFLSVLLPYPWL